MRTAATLVLVLLAALASAGCRYAGPHVERVADVAVTFTAAPSTAVFEAAAGDWTYEFARYEGNAEAAMGAAPQFGVGGRTRKQSSRAVAQPLCGGRAVLKQTGEGRATLTCERRTLELRFLSGSFAELQEGSDVILQLTDQTWDEWSHATQDAFLQVIEDFRRQAAPRSKREKVSTGDARITDFVITEKPLIRANKQRLLVFFEDVELKGGFRIRGLRRDPRYAWWVASYELHPQTAEVLGAIAVVSVSVAAEIAANCARCACR